MTSEQDMKKEFPYINPEGKGGFVKGQSGNPGGRPKNQQSFAYWFNQFKSMTEEELKQWITENPENKRYVAADLALTRILNAKNDLKEFKEVADRSEGRPKQQVDVTSDGERLVPATVVDLGGLKPVPNASRESQR